MQPLLDAIARMDLPTEAVRLFHGRGGLHPGCEHWALDAYPPVLLLTSFRAMDEAWYARHKLALTRREAMHIWMRLLFNKPVRARPPLAPKAFQSMVCVHGDAPTARNGHGTRRQGYKRVRFRLLVSQCHVPALEARGWIKHDAGEPWYLNPDLW